jgi:membrane protease YdiL (CAAX protease family)
VRRLWGLLVALCAAGVALSTPFLLAATRAMHPVAPIPSLLALHGLLVMILCLVAAWAGARFAPGAGLDAPWLRAIADGRDGPGGFGSVLIEATAVGSITAIVVTSIALGFRSAVPEALWRPIPAGFWARASSALYGGTVEETLMRWGVLTALIALAHRYGVREPFWAANALAALVFGALHLASLSYSSIPLTSAVVAYVLLGNGIAGVVFGWMFRRRGLEGAMVAHAASDVWLQAALPALLA